MFELLVKTHALFSYRSGVDGTTKVRKTYYKCVRCRERVHEVVVLMKIPRYLGGTYEADNGYAVCHACL